MFFFNDTATTEIYTLSLHDALPILCHPASVQEDPGVAVVDEEPSLGGGVDRGVVPGHLGVVHGDRGRVVATDRERRPHGDDPAPCPQADLQGHRPVADDRLPVHLDSRAGATRWMWVVTLPERTDETPRPTGSARSSASLRTGRPPDIPARGCAAAPAARGTARRPAPVDRFTTDP